MTPAEVLSKARDVLAERGWVQGSYSTPDGVCIASAIYQAGDSDLDATSAAYDLALSVVGKPPGRALAPWNDDPSRTYEDVVLVLKEAQALAEGEELAVSR